jgi:hypothetical protein
MEERLAVIQQSASCLKKVVIETKESLVPATTQLSGNGLSPSQMTPLTTWTLPETARDCSNQLPNPPAFNSWRKDLPAFIRKLQYKLEGNAD